MSQDFITSQVKMKKSDPHDRTRQDGCVKTSLGSGGWVMYCTIVLLDWIGMEGKSMRYPNMLIHCYRKQVKT